MMDQLSSGTISSNPQPHASSQASSLSTSSVIVQQSNITSQLSSLNNPSEIDGLGTILSNNSSGNSTAASGLCPLSGNRTPVQDQPSSVQQQRIISTTNISTPTPSGGQGSVQSPVLSPPGKVFGRNYNGTSE